MAGSILLQYTTFPGDTRTFRNFPELSGTFEDFQCVLDEMKTMLIENGLVTEEGELGVEMLDVLSGGAHCRVCNSYVKDGFSNMYAHCFKHAWNATMPIVQLLGICFGIVKVL